MPTLKPKGDVHTLHFAASSGHVEVVTALLDVGVDIEARDKCGWTALRFAASSGHVEVVTALLDAGADPKAKNSDGQIPFDHIEDDNPLNGTDTYWRLYEAQF